MKRLARIFSLSKLTRLPRFSPNSDLMVSSITCEKTFGGLMLKLDYLVDGHSVAVLEGNRAVWHIEVNKNYRNKGVGTELLKEFTKLQKKSLEGQTHTENVAMRRVFEKAGFTLIDAIGNEEVTYLLDK